MGAFHSTKNSGFNFRNFRMSNRTVFSTRPDRSRSIPAWAHFPPRITRENAEGSWWSGCLKCRIKLLHLKVYHIFRIQLVLDSYERNLRTFLPGEYANRANWPTGTSERPVHNFPGNQTFSFSIKNRLQLWQIILRVVSTRKTRRHLVAFHD